MKRNNLRRSFAALFIAPLISPFRALLATLPANAEEIRIGFITDLTGLGASFGLLEVIDR